MQSTRDWWYSWFSLVAAITRKTKRVNYLDAKISRLAGLQATSSANLKACEARLERIQRAFDVEMSRATLSVENANRLNKMLEEALESARTELSTLHEMTVPCLVASHQLVLKRTEADIAVQAARSVLATPSRESE